MLHESIKPDARVDELDALVQVEQVTQAIRQLGWQVSTLATGLDLASTITAIRSLAPDCIFNLVESLDGKGSLIHYIPALLSLAEVPYTGADSDAMYLSSQKQLAKQIMHLNQIATAASFDLHDPLIDDDHRWIVKSRWEHASFGMDDACVVVGRSAAHERILSCQSRLGGEWFAELYLDGREYNISVLEIEGKPRILPVAQMVFSDYPDDKPRIVGYAAKWDSNAPEYTATRREFSVLPEPELEEINRLVLQCWRAFGLSGYARIDIRCDATGKPWVLEVNANPCLALDAGFVAAARKAGLGYEQLIDHIIQAALPVDVTPPVYLSVKQS